MQSAIRIEVLSPVEFEDLVAEIYLEDGYLGRVSQEGGEARRMIDFVDGVFREVAVSDLRACIDLACSKLDEMGAKSTAK